MPTSPKPCPTCKGNGKVIVLHDLPSDVDPHWRMAAGVGFSQVRCVACGGRGTTEPPEPIGAYTWPKATDDGSDQAQG